MMCSRYSGQDRDGYGVDLGVSLEVLKGVDDDGLAVDFQELLGKARLFIREPMPPAKIRATFMLYSSDWSLSGWSPTAVSSGTGASHGWNPPVSLP